ncbi:winged helix-turn-helix transcriptional regulator [Clostridium sp. NSJ-49]|uniref:HTH-type transcriptional regulator SarZ n=1 Tax=Clostridium disporicum TaxID=84024 RepID=A0A173YMA6_9CLOT|nr:MULTISPECIES: MarR family winged helix-turn-helix transcriptional regulator [Clostridium]MBC5625990.1 winged helix-turn-helix transcriptional regulator [Clostridium sp. NSJ-49]MCD2501701.1 MarR family winged helix-turn-helix transcriptional regulator [Clostridium sp. NSJ-145]MDU6340507.1 MarR family winged helix-turn-helix transcriptional regulator [Clostridium sp.]CUN64195.1 MarR-family transcriptional regulator [Clostridium disporicum]
MTNRSESESVLNKLLVQLFRDILDIEEKWLQNSEFSDLSVTEIHVIEAISLDKERTMSEVAYDLSITVGTLTTAINKLVKKGYVDRRRIEEDRRVVLVMLTDKGKEVFKYHEEFHNDMVKCTIDSFSKEEEIVLVSALKRVSEFFEEKYHLIK